MEIMQKESTSNTSLDVGVTPQANIISANFILNAQLEGKFTKTINSHKFFWILDSGAINHIVCSVDFIISAREVRGMHVEF